MGPANKYIKVAIVTPRQLVQNFMKISVITFDSQ